jgi:hypothetical protein
LLYTANLEVMHVCNLTIVYAKAKGETIPKIHAEIYILKVSIAASAKHAVSPPPASWSGVRQISQLANTAWLEGSRVPASHGPRIFFTRSHLKVRLRSGVN